MISLTDLSKSYLLLSKSNNGVSKRKSQQRLQENFIPVKEIRDNPGAWIMSLTKGERKLWALIVDFSARYKIVHACQDTMAAMIGYSREWVNRTLNKWDRLGVLRLANRGYISNITKLSAWWKNYPHLRKLGSLVYAFISLALLVPVDSYNHITRREKESIYINYSYIGNREKLQILSQLALERKKNTLKGEIPKPSVSQSPPSEEVILRKIARLLNCDIEIVRKLPEISIKSMISRYPELREYKEKGV